MEIENLSFWHQHQNECLVEAMKVNHFPKEFVDIGGSGIAATAMQHAGYDVTLLQHNLTGIKSSQNQGIQKAIHSTLGNYALNMQGKIPAAGFFDIMEHIENERAFLDQINGILEIHGLIILTVPAFRMLWSRDDEQLGRFRRYNLYDVMDVLEGSGFQVIYKTYFFSLLWPRLWLTRVLPYWLGFRRNFSEKKESEHRAAKPLSSGFLRWLLSWEISAIQNRYKITSGTTCLVVAKKIRNL